MIEMARKRVKRKYHKKENGGVREVGPKHKTIPVIFPRSHNRQPNLDDFFREDGDFRPPTPEEWEAIRNEPDLEVDFDDGSEFSDTDIDDQGFPVDSSEEEREAALDLYRSEAMNFRERVDETIEHLGRMDYFSEDERRLAYGESIMSLIDHYKEQIFINVENASAQFSHEFLNDSEQYEMAFNQILDALDPDVYRFDILRTTSNRTGTDYFMPVFIAENESNTITISNYDGPITAEHEIKMHIFDPAYNIEFDPYSEFNDADTSNLNEVEKQKGIVERYFAADIEIARRTIELGDTDSEFADGLWTDVENSADLYQDSVQGLEPEELAVDLSNLARYYTSLGNLIRTHNSELRGQAEKRMLFDRTGSVSPSDNYIDTVNELHKLVIQQFELSEAYNDDFLNKVAFDIQLQNEVIEANYEIDEEAIRDISFHIDIVPEEQEEGYIYPQLYFIDQDSEKLTVEEVLSRIKWTLALVGHGDAGGDDLGAGAGRRFGGTSIFDEQAKVSSEVFAGDVLSSRFQEPQLSSRQTQTTKVSALDLLRQERVKERKPEIVVSKNEVFEDTGTEDFEPNVQELNRKLEEFKKARPVEVKKTRRKKEPLKFTKERKQKATSSRRSRVNE